MRHVLIAFMVLLIVKHPPEPVPPASVCCVFTWGCGPTSTAACEDAGGILACGPTCDSNFCEDLLGVNGCNRFGGCILSDGTCADDVSMAWCLYWGYDFFEGTECADLPPPPPPVCEGDIDLDGIVGVPDLLLLLAQWGDVCPPLCLGDLDGDGLVGVPDLLMLLAGWGACP